MDVPGSLRLWLIFALAAAVALLYAPSSAVLLEQWSDFVNITYTHGWLILPIALALIYMRRRELTAVHAAPFPAALLVLAAAIIAWLVCYRASIQDLHITIFPALFWLAALAAWGWEVGMLLAFPVAFFYFAVPSWSQLGNPLQDLTVLAMQGFLHITGPSAVFQGDLIHIPNGSFVIEEGCSGLHFLIVGLAVAALHGELRGDSWRTRAAQLLIMAGLALLANWVRVYTVIEAGYLTDMHHYLVSVSHYWFGWGVFGLALIAFFWLTTWLTSPAPPPRPPAQPPQSAPNPGRDALGFALALLVLAALPALSWALRSREALPSLDAAAAATAGAPWSAVGGAEASPWQPVFPGADRLEHLVFANTRGELIEVVRVQYREQRQGAELVGGDSSLLGPGLRWRGAQRIATSDGDFTQTEAAAAGDARSLIWWRYEIAGRALRVPLGAQLLYGLHATVSHPTAALIAVRSECDAGCPASRQALEQFLAQVKVR
ncbi:MAG: EpsI family protein [Gammaproteobacteria bacterium]|nr:EpsI family protein [Gammaproteobacteria bacterium]